MFFTYSGILLRLLFIHVDLSYCFMSFHFCPKYPLVFLLGQVCSNKLYLYLFGNVLILPLFLKDSLYFFSLSHWIVSVDLPFR